MRILIVPDKFKGTLTAEAAAHALARGWSAARPVDQLELLPMSDGGDGFGELTGHMLGGIRQLTTTVNAAHEPTESEWWWVESSQTAVIESAKVIGLAMLPAGKFHPFALDTFGLGELISKLTNGFPIQKIIMGIGGSATNDAGFGMARALGYKFLDASARQIQSWTDLNQLSQIRPTKLPEVEVTIATDVQNPLMGPEGATRIYGPQKGIRPEDLSVADASFEQLAKVVKSDLGMDAADIPGTGAAGGLGYGLRVFLHGVFEPGFDIFARLSRLEEKMNSCDLVLTAEGAIDASTAMGKGTGAIAQLARKYHKPCIGFAGMASPAQQSFHTVYSITPALAEMEQSKKEPAKYLEVLAQRAAEQYNPK
jgi:glycerate kinase